MGISICYAYYLLDLLDTTDGSFIFILYIVYDTIGFYTVSWLPVWYIGITVWTIPASDAWDRTIFIGFGCWYYTSYTGSAGGWTNKVYVRGIWSFYMV